MTPLQARLAGYGAYHRDRRNVLTHLVGIPLIVFAVVILLSRSAFPVGPLAVTPAMVAAALATLFYLRLDVPFGIAMAVLLGLACWAGVAITRQAGAASAAVGGGLFVLGWAIQFVGHAFEGRKPAFLDDLAGLIVGPLFVVAELAVLLGLRRELAPVLHGSSPAAE